MCLKWFPQTLVQELQLPCCYTEKKNRNSNFREKRISVKILHLSLCLWGTLKNKARESWWCSKCMLNEKILGMARVCGLGL